VAKARVAALGVEWGDVLERRDAIDWFRREEADAIGADAEPRARENFAWRSGVTASEAFGFFGRKIVTICSIGCSSITELVTPSLAACS